MLLPSNKIRLWLLGIPFFEPLLEILDSDFLKQKVYSLFLLVHSVFSCFNCLKIHLIFTNTPKNWSENWCFMLRFIPSFSEIKQGILVPHLGWEIQKSFSIKIWINACVENLAFGFFCDITLINIIFVFALLLAVQKVWSLSCDTRILMGTFGCGNLFFIYLIICSFEVFGRTLWLLKMVNILFKFIYQIKILLLCLLGIAQINILLTNEWFIRWSYFNLKNSDKTRNQSIYK